MLISEYHFTFNVCSVSSSNHILFNNSTLLNYDNIKTLKINLIYNFIKNGANAELREYSLQVAESLASDCMMFIETQFLIVKVIPVPSHQRITEMITTKYCVTTVL